MAKIYYRRIIAKQITIDDVPERYKEAVKKLLESEEM